MGQVVNSNIASLNAQRNLNKSASSLGVSLQRLSSGLRINSAADDAAGLAISERMTSQIRGLNQAVRNANDGISLAQTTEGALGETTAILQRIRELAVQSSNATNTTTDRKALQQEVGQLTSELQRIATTSEFNGQKLLDGTFGTATFQVGANAGQTIDVQTGNFKTDQYGVNQLAGDGNSAGSAARLDGETLTINGSDGTKTVTVAANDSAGAAARAVNAKTADTNVTASAKTDVDLTFSATGAYSLTLGASDNATFSGQSTVTFTISATSTSDGLSAAVSAINDFSSKTGVTAKVNSDATGVTLTNAAGQNLEIDDIGGVANAGDIVVKNGTGGAGSDQTLSAASGASAAGVATGQVTFESAKSFSVTGDTDETLSGSGGASTLKEVADLDVSTFDKAQLALAIVDGALSAVNSKRGEFGAVQSRFNSVINSLSATSENLSAARSRIRDTDFAAETAELTRTQILQQAGVSILSQANVLPQAALSLLG